MQNELWAPVKTWERRYEVSNLGHVRDIHKKSGPMLVPLTVMQDGTVQVYLHHNSRRRWPRVHVLMAEAFLPNPDGLPCVEHLNGNRSDNRNQNDRYVRHIAAKLNHHDEADQSADGDLAVSTKVPEFHFESWDESKTNSKEKGAIS